MEKSRDHEDTTSRVALCHLESLVCLPAIDRLFTQMGGNIGLVILSDRFGSKYGGPFRQFVANVRRSGLRLTLWLGFDIVAAQVVGRLGCWIEKLTRKRPRFASVRELGRRHGATLLEVADVNGANTIAALKAFAPDIVLVMNFDQILRRDFIAAARGRVVNVHPSLLPALRGPCPVFWAQAEGRSEAGVSLHLIEDEKIDAGPVLAQRTRPLSRTCSVAEVTAELFEAGAGLVPDIVKALREARTAAQLQSMTEASYRGFPNRLESGQAWRDGVRLCRFRHVARLLWGAVRHLDGLPPARS